MATSRRPAGAPSASPLGNSADSRNGPKESSQQRKSVVRSTFITFRLSLNRRTNKGCQLILIERRADEQLLALLERIILSSTQEGDVVLDPFCGCGTTKDPDGARDLAPFHTAEKGRARILGHVVDREKAKIGVFITLAEPTGP